MPYVGFSGVANQANTTDGFALGVGAQNDPAAEGQFGLDVGDGGVVDLYHDGAPDQYSFILMEDSGYVLEQDDSKIQLEVG